MMNRVKRILSRPQVHTVFDAYFSAVQRPERGGPTYSEAKRDFREYIRRYQVSTTNPKRSYAAVPSAPLCTGTPQP